MSVEYPTILKLSNLQSSHQLVLRIWVKMARANLNISPDITEEFIKAQETRLIRILKIRIDQEQLVLDSVVNRLDSASEDFDNLLVNSLIEDQACFAIFCLTDATPVGLPPPPGSGMLADCCFCVTGLNH